MSHSSKAACRSCESGGHQREKALQFVLVRALGEQMPHAAQIAQSLFAHRADEQDVVTGLDASLFHGSNKTQEHRQAHRIVANAGRVQLGIFALDLDVGPSREYRRERIKNLDVPSAMPYRPIETMNNTAWQRARAAADLGDLHVHDLRHTVATRLREAGAAQQTISDILWHSKRGMTAHYTLAQLRELHEALEKVSTDSGRWNRSLSMLKREHASVQLNRVPQNSP